MRHSQQTQYLRYGNNRQYISEATGLNVEKLLSGEQGGEEQIASRIEYNEIDVLIYFRDTRPSAGFTKHDEIEKKLLLACDRYNVPVATNIADRKSVV